MLAAANAMRDCERDWVQGQSKWQWSWCVTLAAVVIVQIWNCVRQREVTSREKGQGNVGCKRMRASSVACKARCSSVVRNEIEWEKKLKEWPVSTKKWKPVVEWAHRWVTQVDRTMVYSLERVRIQDSVTYDDNKRKENFLSYLQRSHGNRTQMVVCVRLGHQAYNRLKVFAPWEMIGIGKKKPHWP